MKILTILLFVCNYAAAQELQGDKIVLNLPEASRIDYWGRKGISAESLITSLDLNLQLLKQDVKFQESINKNLMGQTEEYRTQLQKLAVSNQAMLTQILDLEKDKEKYKTRARRRGNIIAAGMIVLGALAYISL